MIADSPPSASSDATLPGGSNMGLVEASTIVIEDVDVTFDTDKV